MSKAPPTPSPTPRYREVFAAAVAWAACAADPASKEPACIAFPAACRFSACTRLIQVWREVMVNDRLNPCFLPLVILLASQFASVAASVSIHFENRRCLVLLVMICSTPETLRPQHRARAHMQRPLHDVMVPELPGMWTGCLFRTLECGIYESFQNLGTRLSHDFYMPSQ